jgi:hypothetical protein
MNNFELNEQIGRKDFNTLCNTKGWLVNFTKNPYECFDAIIELSSGKQAIIEIKKRDIKYLTYDSVIVEKNKYNRLKNISCDLPILYCEIFESDNELIY